MPLARTIAVSLRSCGGSLRWLPALLSAIVEVGVESPAASLAAITVGTSIVAEGMLSGTMLRAQFAIMQSPHLGHT